LHAQLAGELPTSPDGRRGLVLSASKELEPGSRTMLLLAEGLFRLDIVLTADTIRTVVRNLSPGKLNIERDSGYGLPNAIATEDAVAYRPGTASLTFTVGSGTDRVRAEVAIGTLRFDHRGAVRVTAQAIVRQAPAD
jgi:hypothetical protein